MKAKFLSAFEVACEQNASDLHLSTGRVPYIRVDGVLVPLSDPPVLDHEIKLMAQSVIHADLMESYLVNESGDYSAEIEAGGVLRRVRVNFYRHHFGPAAAIRILPQHVQSLEDIGAPALLSELAQAPRGLVLVCGPTGSGKSTTLNGMVHHINTTQQRHVLTLEDPIELIHTSARGLIHQREIGKDTPTFQAGLRDALREDPDVIVVGEMRDLETIRLALTAAETGHLVLGSVHTMSAPKAVDRIIDVFPESEKGAVRMILSESIQAVISQVLLKRVDGPGRVAAHEIMVATPAIRNLIREGRTESMRSVLATGKTEGMKTLDQDLQNLLTSKRIDREAALALAQDRTFFNR
ncbi:PilT/PilU family type 4a pilus ATPase [Castellaniella sp.]|uniref:type IV pilus twitching motility protein PilT n=1 Tax=Castellaniella sp. TaxID=1955812 RepID=UPI002AFDF278|nr:PilT/PilU family type 4a pilus ATPase [Castellaniella sp.]